MAAVGMNLGVRPPVAIRQPRSISGGGQGGGRILSPQISGPAPEPRYACLLINGTDGIYAKLGNYSTDDVELLEVYPPKTELSGTASWHFHDSHCKTMSLIDHPTYYVLWLKGRK
jgi:hypothetical protein